MLSYMDWRKLIRICASIFFKLRLGIEFDLDNLPYLTKNKKEKFAFVCVTAQYAIVWLSTSRLQLCNCLHFLQSKSFSRRLFRTGWFLLVGHIYILQIYLKSLIDHSILQFALAPPLSVCFSWKRKASPWNTVQRIHRKACQTGLLNRFLRSVHPEITIHIYFLLFWAYIYHLKKEKTSCWGMQNVLPIVLPASQWE